MMVKRYVVEDIPEAVVLIRRELGKDAVILSTRKVTQKQWLGLWRKKRIEVLAAAGEDMPIQTSIKRANGTAITPSGEESRNPPTLQRLDPVQGGSTGVKPVSHQIERKQSGLVQVSERGDDGGTDRTVIEQLRDEVADMRTTLQTLMRQSGSEAAHASPLQVQSQMETHLNLQGLVSTDLVAAVMRAAARLQVEGSDSSTLQSDSWLQDVYALLSQCSRPEPVGAGSRVVAFVGQTGVGKTTTIAKIAALQMLTGNRRVGLITADTYRIAAVEQLRTYARILDIPLHIVNKPEELDAAVDSLSDKDLILVDTAGRNYSIEENFQEMSDLLKRPCIDETHLVVSLTSKPDDLHRIVTKFAGFSFDKLLFTKLDETSTYGPALELLYRYQKPFSYFTNGQNVPDDIEIGTLERLIRLVLKGAA